MSIDALIERNRRHPGALISPARPRAGREKKTNHPKALKEVDEEEVRGGRERVFFIDNLLVRIHLIIVMIRGARTGTPNLSSGFAFEQRENNLKRISTSTSKQR